MNDFISSHLVCVWHQACISGKMYSFAHDFISNTTILEVNPKQSFLETSDFLKYFYYSGIVYIAVKNFKKALECFNEVMSFPADILSAVCVEAYKKAVLVSLIENGKAYSFPRYIIL
jgi:COP9 signalosome complex subunit 3